MSFHLIFFFFSRCLLKTVNDLFSHIYDWVVIPDLEISDKKIAQKGIGKARGFERCSSLEK